MKMHVRFVAIAAVAGTAWAGPALAQAPGGGTEHTARPTYGLFTREPENPRVHHRLDLSLATGEAYDSNVLDLLDPIIEGTVSTASGFVSSLDPSLTYSWRGSRATVAAEGGTRLRYYTNQQGFIALHNYGGIGVSLPFSSRTTLFAHQSVSYLPDYLFSTVPAFEAPSVTNLVDASTSPMLSKESAYRYNSDARLDHALSPTSSFSFIGRYYYADLARTNDGGDMRAFDIGGRYQRVLSHTMTLHIGYLNRTARYQNSDVAPSVLVHEIDTGIDYHRSLSFSRRTKLQFNAGSAVLNRPVQASETSGRLQYQVVGQATLDHEIGRSWRARLLYSRSLGFVERLQEPVLADALRASLDGLVSPRIDLQAGGGVSFGQVTNPINNGNAFRTYQANSRVTVALNSKAAIYTEYAFFFYDLGVLLRTPTGFVQPAYRNSVAVGLTIWRPLVRR
jgi:hypothetical protein